MGEKAVVADGDRGVVSTDSARDLDWEIVKALTDAQSHTNASLGQYLLYMTHGRDLDSREVDVCLDEAIANHERAIEDLRTAQRRLQQAGDN